MKKGGREKKGKESYLELTVGQGTLICDIGESKLSRFPWYLRFQNFKTTFKS